MSLHHMQPWMVSYMVLIFFFWNVYHKLEVLARFNQCYISTLGNSKPSSRASNQCCYLTFLFLFLFLSKPILQWYVPMHVAESVSMEAIWKNNHYKVRCLIHGVSTLRCLVADRVISIYLLCVGTVRLGFLESKPYAQTNQYCYDIYIFFKVVSYLMDYTFDKSLLSNRCL